MTQTETGLCRITVHGPGGRADLAVPTGTTVGALLPVLVRRLVDRPADDSPSWVLQRLDSAPMDPDGTALSLDWLDGEELHLRPADDPLPELDHDDVAEGIAAAVNRHPDRWTDPIKQVVFHCLGAVALAVAGGLLVAGTDRWVPVWTSGVVGVVLATVSVLLARAGRGRLLLALASTAGCLFLALASALAVDGGAAVAALRADVVLVGGAVVAASAGALLGLRAVLAPRLPLEPLGVLAAVPATWTVLVWWGGGRMGPGQAALVALALLVVLVFSPRVATRGARLRGPQLPRRSEELGVDVEPAPAGPLTEQTARADRYLTIIAVGVSVLVVPCEVVLLAEPSWDTRLVVALAAVLVLVRAREYLNAVQRTALAASGAVGLVLALRSQLAAMPPGWVPVAVLLLVTCAALLSVGAHRPVHRRALPVWAFTVDMLELFLAIALTPLVLHLAGVYTWARGLAG